MIRGGHMPSNESLLASVKRTEKRIDDLDGACLSIGEGRMNEGRTYQEIEPVDKTILDPIIDDIIGQLWTVVDAVLHVADRCSSGPSVWDADATAATAVDRLKQPSAVASLKRFAANPRQDLFSAICTLVALTDRDRKLVYVPLPGVSPKPNAITVGLESNVHGDVYNALSEPCRDVVEGSESLVVRLRTVAGHLDDALTGMV